MSWVCPLYSPTLPHSGLAGGLVGVGVPVTSPEGAEVRRVAKAALRTEPDEMSPAVKAPSFLMSILQAVL